MIDFRVSPETASDLEEIWNFIAQDNPIAANRVIEQILDVFRRLADTPRMGRQREELAAGLRSHPFGNYIILYKIRGEYIEITRIIHSARNLHAIFHPDH
ncbi:MAG: type II toxin-antitoxin system RelE/ParE family toxin [Phycisphaerales bacterium]|nr:type II toxin-antitoxin system RelE/ParE family toxin [Phycisphaerales bacterium]